MLFPAAFLLAQLPAAFAAPSNEPPSLEKRAPLIQARAGKVVPGKYIVKFRDDSADATLTAAAGKHKANHLYKSAFKGFAGAFGAASLEEIRKLPEVEYVEEDAVITIADGFNTKTDTAPRAIVSQLNVPWNLARLSSHTPGSSTYKYDSTAGSGTCSYILDTGITTTLAEFSGRAVFGANFANDGNIDDGNGHGTSVAAIVGGTTLGVAKLTKLVAVKIFDASGSGTNSAVIAALNWVVTDKATRGCSAGVSAVIAASGSFSSALNTAVNNMVASGVFTAAAAGSDGTNVGNVSPGSAASACTAGATTSSDTVASYSNYGPLLDIWAPGTGITTTFGGTTTTVVSGTTYAAAHIAGLGAYLLSLPSSLTAQGLCAYIQSIATAGVLTGVPSGTVNLLAYNGWDI
ncbi:alkaline protease [Pseudoneurospora amorphoporcata]|uniref:Alkaline protease n=1 Tax=Pseudoneurospora amorphoporcata TaxID=241081 RepID=A0AAN6SF44_9PEZI|nr:alkaline protease [Pseudoneurospora amorphoporcata]